MKFWHSNSQKLTFADLPNLASNAGKIGRLKNASEDNESESEKISLFCVWLEWNKKRCQIRVPTRYVAVCPTPAAQVAGS